MRLTLALLAVLAAPLAGQSLVRVEPPVPVGYWSMTTEGYNPETMQKQVHIVVLRFEAAHTFRAVLKTKTEDEEGIGSTGVFRGEWVILQVWGKPVVCVRRPDQPNPVCVYAIVGDGLRYADRALLKRDSADVAVLAPELTREGE
jgi:hypothetical protein